MRRNERERERDLFGYDDTTNQSIDFIQIESRQLLALAQLDRALLRAHYLLDYIDGMKVGIMENPKALSILLILHG